MKTATEKRVEELKTARRATARAEATAERKLADARLRAIAASDVALADAAARDARMRMAEDTTRAENPVLVVISQGRVRVTVDVSARDAAVRQTAEMAVRIAVNRLQRFQDALVGDARMSAASGRPQHLAATPDEIAAFLADEVRAAIKMGTATISVLPVKRARK